jgi:hypothetical protein
MTSMDLRSRQEAALRIDTAVDLFSAGCDMMKQKLMREHPDADDETIERLLCEWLHIRPGAEFGDAEGSPGRRFASTITSHE